MELLAPAGSLDRLKVALDYGADAVFLGGEIFGLRAKAPNFTHEDLLEGVNYAHQRNKKVYMTLNIIPHNEDLEALKEYLHSIADIGIDAYIVSDPGTMLVIRDVIYDAEIHLSTQANAITSQTCRFWFDQGVKRVILGRELSLDEIRQIVSDNPQGEFEVFVHGAMCMAYSGRCLISNYLSGRDANRGDCVQACRWNYYLVEETRPGNFIPVVEEEEGTAILQAHDLNTICFLDEIINTGVKSLKIEGRNKTEFYVASVVRAYREAIRRFEAGETETADLEEELLKVSHRTYSSGFYNNNPTSGGRSLYEGDYDFIGKVVKVDGNKALIEQRGKFCVNDEVEIFGPDFSHVTFKIEGILTQSGEDRDCAPHPKELVWISVPEAVKVGDFMRKKKPVSSLF